MTVTWSASVDRWLSDATCWPTDLHDVQNRLRQRYLQHSASPFTRAVCGLTIRIRLTTLYAYNIIMPLGC